MLFSTRWGRMLTLLALLLAGAGATQAQRIAAGNDHSVSIHADGTLWTWGRGLGTGRGALTYQPTPAQLGPVTTWQRVVSCGSHTLALRQDGTLWAWGDNGAGQLGLGTGTDQPTPTQVGTATWLSVATSYNFSLGVRADGTLWAWGNNYYGQLGDGTTTTQRAPVRVGTASTWRSVACGFNNGVALRQDGTLWTWGSNNYGQLGTGSSAAQQLAPAQVGSATWQSVAAGYDHVLALRPDGTLWAWGGNGQVGTGGAAQQPTPVQVGTAATWQSVAAGAYHSAAIRADGTLWTWGSNLTGQLGNGSRTRGQQAAPAQVGTATTWQSVAAGAGHTVALQADGTLWTWGHNVLGQLGNNTGLLLTPTRVALPDTWRSVAASYSASAAIRPDGTLWTWGGNYYGQLGNGLVSSGQDVPLQLLPGTTWQLVAASLYHHLAIRQDGTLWTWGYNGGGQLGQGNTVSVQATPVQIGTAATWQTVAGGYGFSLGIRQDGTLWGWGQNSTGQLASLPATPTAPQLTPAQIGTVSSWQTVACGEAHTLALRTDGSLWVWGDNSYGQLGLGSAAGTGPPTAPVRLGTDTWLSVAAGNLHALAVRADGTLWAWGDNQFGQVGNGTTAAQPTPVQVGTATTWRNVAAGYYASLALRQDGTLWAWGDNQYGQTGTGAAGAPVLTPTPVSAGPGTTWQSLATGGASALAIRPDGTLWTWGYNGGGVGAQPDFVAAPLYVPNGGAPLATVAPATTAGWALAPNPAREAVQVLGLPAGPVQVRVLDATGRLVRQAGSATVPIAGLAPGLYLLHATAGEATRTLRLAVE